MTRKEFQELSIKNNWEVYTQRQVYQFSQDLLKSIDSIEREQGAIDYISLNRVEVVNDDLTKSVMYWREQQVIWDKSENGELMKARSGVYADTSVNRKKGIVGQRYGGTKDLEDKIKAGRDKIEEDKYGEGTTITEDHLKRAREIGRKSKSSPYLDENWKKFEQSVGKLNDKQKIKLLNAYNDGKKEDSKK